jgi:hypothetical protein
VDPPKNRIGRPLAGAANSIILLPSLDQKMSPVDSFQLKVPLRLRRWASSR